MARKPPPESTGVTQVSDETLAEIKDRLGASEVMPRNDFGTVMKRGETDIVPEVAPSNAFSDDELQQVTNFDEAIRLATEKYGEIARFGHGFRVATDEDKVKLQGVKMLFMDWTFRDGDFGPFVSAIAVSQDSENNFGAWIINDGSKGICQQLWRYTKETGKTGGLAVKGGLRVSEFSYCSERGCEDFGTALNREGERAHGVAGKATGRQRAYYLDTSA